MRFLLGFYVGKELGNVKENSPELKGHRTKSVFIILSLIFEEILRAGYAILKENINRSVLVILFCEFFILSLILGFLVKRGFMLCDGLESEGFFLGLSGK